MEIYSVGGWVRDRYLREIHHLDLPEGDRDWVVVGATPEQMIQKGFRSVGKDFPVFLHPKTHEEYALARLERKVAPGYHGFAFDTSPDVTLEEDLSRRDLTINAMAYANGTLFDPYGGLEDIRQRRLRHVSLAFKEDPVRILRVARFNARWPMFNIADETMSLMKEMVENGEADALVAERVFQEFKKGFSEENPSTMITVLQRCGLWQRLFPMLPMTENDLARLDESARLQFSLAERMAVLLLSTDDIQAEHFLKTLKAPTDIVDLTTLAIKTKSNITSVDSAESALAMLERCDALRRPSRFFSLLKVINCRKTIDMNLWTEAYQNIVKIDAGEIAKSQTDKRAIPLAIRQARLQALKEVFL